MRRSPHSRVLSLALSLWLALFLSGSERVVECPTHSGGMTAVAAHAGGAITGDTADHDHAAGESAPESHGAGHNCSCPGPGCCPSAVATVPGSLAPLTRIVAVHEAAALSALAAFSSTQDHFHPFATAPPTVASGPAAISIA